MLIYEPDLPRIRLELGVLYFRLNAYPSAKLYLSSVKKYDPPEEVLKKVESFLELLLGLESKDLQDEKIGLEIETEGSNDYPTEVNLLYRDLNLLMKVKKIWKN